MPKSPEQKNKDPEQFDKEILKIIIEDDIDGALEKLHELGFSEIYNNDLGAIDTLKIVIKALQKVRQHEAERIKKEVINVMENQIKEEEQMGSRCDSEEIAKWYLISSLNALIRIIKNLSLTQQHHE